MKLFDDVIIKATGQRGTIVDEGTANGKHYFIVELDNAADFDDEHAWEALSTCWDDALEPV